MKTAFQTVVRGRDGNCPVRVGRGLLSRLGETAGAAVPGRAALLVSDSNVAPLHLPAAKASLEKAGFRVGTAVLRAGERSKTPASLVRLWGACHRAGLGRDGLVVALGGGVVGDLAGFAAATWMRGVAVLQVPTSLLAFVDSSVGGKTGVDLPFGKNLAGAFHQPCAVLADPLLLRTLPAREFAGGMAEVVKYGCIRDRAFFDWLGRRAGKKLSGADLERVVASSVRAKADVVNADEREGGVRETLNFGHTAGHALETVLGYGAVSHGEAVAAGSAAAARLGEALGVSEPGTADAVRSLLEAWSLPTRAADLPGGARKAAPAAGFRAMLSDKKKRGADLRFVLLRRIGEAVVVPVAPARVRALLPEIL